jgi:hypothetical protein
MALITGGGVDILVAEPALTTGQRFVLTGRLGDILQHRFFRIKSFAIASMLLFHDNTPFKGRRVELNDSNNLSRPTEYAI